MIEEIKKNILHSKSPEFAKETYYNIINQGIEGFIREDEVHERYFKNISQRNQSTKIRNIIYLNWADEFSKIAHKKKWKVIFLKGIVLLEDIYTEMQHRTLGDIDILISKEIYSNVEQYLIDDGFKKTGEKKWKGNNFKSNLVKTIHGIEVVIELHSRLFMNEDSINWESTPFKNKFSRRLTPTDELVHLMGHLAYQHTFLKIHWLLDIALHLKKYQNELDMNRFHKLNSKLGHKNSTYSVLIALRSFDIKHDLIKTDLFRRIIFKIFNNKKFLCAPKSHKLNYFIIKHATKSSWYESIKYDILWLCYQLKQLKRNRF